MTHFFFKWKLIAQLSKMAANMSQSQSSPLLRRVEHSSVEVPNHANLQRLTNEFNRVTVRELVEDVDNQSQLNLTFNLPTDISAI
jgi:hypothetical protein